MRNPSLMIHRIERYWEPQSPPPSNLLPWGLLTQAIWLQAASAGPDWVMRSLCWTSTSYQVSHKGSFIKLDSPLIFIALIKGHKRLFFLACGVRIIISINWAPFNIIDPEILISKRQLPTRSMKDQLVQSRRTLCPQRLGGPVHAGPRPATPAFCHSRKREGWCNQKKAHIRHSFRVLFLLFLLSVYACSCASSMQLKNMLLIGVSLSLCHVGLRLGPESFTCWAISPSLLLFFLIEK